MQQYVLAALLGVSSAINVMEELDMPNMPMAAAGGPVASPSATHASADSPTQTWLRENKRPPAPAGLRYAGPQCPRLGPQNKKEWPSCAWSYNVTGGSPGSETCEMECMDKVVEPPFVPKYKYPVCGTAVPADEWLEEPTHLSAACETHWYYAQTGTGKCSWECMEQINYDRPAAPANFHWRGPVCPTKPTTAKPTDGKCHYGWTNDPFGPCKWECAEQNEGPIPVCNGQFGAQYVIPKWHAPFVKTVEECMERCAGTENCTMITYRYQTGWCWGGSRHDNRCFPFGRENETEQTYDVTPGTYVRRPAPKNYEYPSPACLTAPTGADATMPTGGQFGWSNAGTPGSPECKWELPKPKSICDGQYGEMIVIPGWHAPPVKTVEECMTRCADTKDCSVILFEEKNGFCWGGSKYAGKCYENPEKQVFVVESAPEYHRPAAPAGHHYVKPACFAQPKDVTLPVGKGYSDYGVPGSPDCKWETPVSNGPKSICDGSIASMDVIPGYNFGTPYSHTPEECLDRCDKEPTCIVVLFNSNNGQCWACTQFHGTCHPQNNGHHIYLARNNHKAMPLPAGGRYEAPAHPVSHSAPAPESICNGGYASMNGVGNWNYETPHSKDANACLERCAGRSDCKYIRYNYKNNNCFAYKDHSGQCYPNDHDHIYARDGRRV